MKKHWITGTRSAIDLGQGVKLDLVWVAGGAFRMGGSPGDQECEDGEKPSHDVKLDGFWMGIYEVTQLQWEAVMGQNPSYFKGDNLPVESVSWDDTQGFLSKAAKSCGPLRLPTEAQWEYAARGGETGAWYGNLDDIAWYGNNSGKTRLDALALWNEDESSYADKLLANGCQTHPVGQKKPNAYGLYDMIGNVWEWCEDAYDRDAYKNRQSMTSDSFVDAVGVGSMPRVVRGGSWFDYARNSRVSARFGLAPSLRDNGSLGFRVVCSGSASR